MRNSTVNKLKSPPSCFSNSNCVRRTSSAVVLSLCLICKTRNASLILLSKLEIISDAVRKSAVLPTCTTCTSSALPCTIAPFPASARVFGFVVEEGLTRKITFAAAELPFICGAGELDDAIVTISNLPPETRIGDVTRHVKRVTERGSVGRIVFKKRTSRWTWRSDHAPGPKPPPCSWTAPRSAAGRCRRACRRGSREACRRGPPRRRRRRRPTGRPGPARGRPRPSWRR